MKTLTTIKNRIASFDQDERGMETLQVVLIIAIAAMILALIVNAWPAISDWAQKAIETVTGGDMSKSDGSGVKGGGGI